jgi:hypothetical protein
MQVAEEKKSELDIVVFYKGAYYYLGEEKWKKAARELSEGERTVLVPMIEHGTVVAHVDEESPKFGSWTNLVNLDGLLAMHKARKKNHA